MPHTQNWQIWPLWMTTKMRFCPYMGVFVISNISLHIELNGKLCMKHSFYFILFYKKNKQRPNRRNILLVRQHEKSSNKERQLRIRRISRPKQRQAPNTQAPPRAGHSLTCVFFPKSNTISQSLQVIQLK